ncbi:hypothetical protein ACWDWV_31605 [Streptosporangium sandarakinum]
MSRRTAGAGERDEGGLMSVAAVGLALLGSLFFALGAALQQSETGPDRVALRHLARRPRWLLGGLAVGAGTALHVLALRYGPLTLVQPLGAASLLFALPCAAALRRHRPRPRELAAAAAVAPPSDKQTSQNKTQNN